MAQRWVDAEGSGSVCADHATTTEPLSRFIESEGFFASVNTEDLVVTHGDLHPGNVL